MLFRSNILAILYKYISSTYTVGAFDNEKIQNYDNLIRMVQRDEEFINLFCFIIYKRLIIIDDIEFQGKTQQKLTHPFIAFEDIRYVSWILNNIAYRVFYNKFNIGLFTPEF